MKIGHCKELIKLRFRALALPQSDCRVRFNNSAVSFVQRDFSKYKHKIKAILTYLAFPLQ